MAWVNEHLRQKTQDRPPRPHPNVRPVTLPIRSSSITRRPRTGGGPWHCPRIKNKDAGARREPGIGCGQARAPTVRATQVPALAHSSADQRRGIW